MGDTAAAGAGDRVRRVDEIADAYVDEWAALHPLGATYAGIAGHDDEMTDLSPDGFAGLAELDRRTLAALAATEAVDQRERAAKDAMVERLTIDLERYDAGDTTSALNVISSGLHMVRESFDLMPTEGDEAVGNIATRLAAVPEALAGLRRTFLDAADRGHVAARRQVLAVADQCDSWTGRASGGSDDFYAGLVARLKDGQPDQLERAAAAARDATVAFGQFLRDELAPRAAERDQVGEQRYARASRYFLGAAVDLAEAYAWGWEELARIESQMRGLAVEITGEDDIAAAAAALDADPARQIAGKETFRAWMQERADRMIAEMHGTHFDIPEPVRRIECRIAPTSDGSIYYTGPSEDFSRPGRMWWAVPAGVDTFSTWRETTTVHHEGVPGHHLQIGQTAYRRDLLNRWQRHLCWVSGHGEGWALYAERLCDELGYLADPGDKLGMLDMNGFRAVRVIVDIGMHLELPIPAGTGWHEGERWTPELGWEFMRAHSRMDEAFLRFEHQRYLGWPGQAPSYKLGERIWMQAREDAKRRNGAGFDLTSFHRSALDLGAIGLDPLRKALARL